MDKVKIKDREIKREATVIVEARDDEYLKLGFKIMGVFKRFSRKNQQWLLRAGVGSWMKFKFMARGTGKIMVPFSFGD